jgi:hypothetical protein
MLEAVRDLMLVPKLDAGLYAAYRANRAQNQDVINSFSYAVSQSLGGGAWCRPERNGKCDLPFQRVDITITDWTKHGGEKTCVLSLQSSLKDWPALHKRLSDRALSSVGQNPEQNGIRFCLGNYHVSVNNTALHGVSPNPAITRHFANVIVRKINAQGGSRATVGTE